MRSAAAKAMLVLVVSAVASGVASADGTQPPRRNNVTASVVAYGPTATYVRALTGWISTGVSFTYLPPGIESYSLLGAAVVVRSHPTHTRNPRLFFEANVQAYRVFDVESVPGVHLNNLVVGIAVGWRWSWSNGLNVGIGAGADYFFDTGDQRDGRYLRADEGVYPRPFLDMGYAF